MIQAFHSPWIIVHVTVLITVIFAILGVILGSIIATIRPKKVPVLKPRFIRWISLCGAMPFLVQLFLLLKKSCPIWGLTWKCARSRICVCCVYISYIAASSWNHAIRIDAAAPAGEKEAAKGPGMTRVPKRIASSLPQAFTMSIPPLVSKPRYRCQQASSLIFNVGVVDMMRAASQRRQ